MDALCTKRTRSATEVTHAGNNKLHHFELAPRQRVKKPTGCISFHAASALFGRSDKGALDASQQFAISKWLRKKIDRACFHRLPAHRQSRRKAQDAARV